MGDIRPDAGIMKIRAFAVGALTGATIGAVSSALHSGGVTKHMGPRAAFMAIVLGVGAAIKA